MKNSCKKIKHKLFIMLNAIWSLNGVCVGRARDKVFFAHSIFLFCLLLSANNAHGYDELHIGGIFPIAGKGGWQGGQACMPAARLALEDVNSKNDLLPGFKLILHSNDSEVSTTISFRIKQCISTFSSTCSETERASNC